MNSFKTKFILGTWPLSGDYGVYSKKNVIDVIDAAIENKIYEIDTAPNYGNGIIEKIIGDEFKKKIIINTKVGSLINKSKSFRLEDIEKSFYSSLERLKRNKINTLFIHNPRISSYKLQKIFEFLILLKEKNQINNIGISLANNHNYSFKILEKFDVVQDDFNLLNLSYFFKKKHPKEFQARSILASGLLSIRGNNFRFNLQRDHRSSWLKGSRLNYLNQHIKKINNIIDLPIENFARRFVLQQTFVNKAIFGVRTKKQLFNLLEDLRFKELSNEMVMKIIEIYKIYSKNKELKY